MKEVTYNELKESGFYYARYIRGKSGLPLLGGLDYCLISDEEKVYEYNKGDDWDDITEMLDIRSSLYQTIEDFKEDNPINTDYLMKSRK